MPVWSMAKACHEGLAPRPGSANVFVRRIGTVLARVSPAGFTTVPMTVSTPSASSWAIAAAASGVPVMAAILPPAPARSTDRGAVNVAWSRLCAAGQGQLAGLADIEGPQHSSHADPQCAGQGQVGKQLVGEVFGATAPEVFVVAQDGVLGGESVRELGRQPFLFAVAGPGAPLQRVVVQLFIDTVGGSVGGSVGVAGVDADDAFVVVSDHGARELAGAQRQSVLGVDSLAETGERAAEVRRFRKPAGQVV